MSLTGGTKVTELSCMDGMFYGAFDFNQNISSWNASAVTRMDGMFTGAMTFNGDICSFNTAAVTNMSFMC